MDRKRMGEPRKVRNQDILLLQSVYFLMQEVVSLEHRREWQKDRMNSLAQHLTGMPGGGGNPRGMDEAFAQLSELEEKHRRLVERYASELKRAERIINSIKSANMRTFVAMMYLDNLPDREVRERLNMTRYGFDRARNAIEQAESMKDVIWEEKYLTQRENFPEFPKTC